MKHPYPLYASLALLALLPPGCKAPPAETSVTTPAEQAAQPTAQQPTQPVQKSTSAPVTEDVEEGDDDEPLEPEVPKTLAPAPHPIFEHWAEVFKAESSPESIYFYKEGEALSEEEQEELDEIRGKALIALEAGKKLFRARWDIIEGATQVPGANLREEEAEATLSLCREWLAECFRRDLEALSFGNGWLSQGCVAPPLRPGRQELLFRPTQEELDFNQVDGCTAEIGWGYARVNGVWEQRQDAFMKRFLSLYGGGELGPSDNGLRDPFIDLPWQQDEDGKLTPGAVRFRTAMQAKIREEQQIWKQYQQAMVALVSPSRGFTGSGSGIFMTAYESHLLDTRERFICLLTTRFEGVKKLTQHETLRRAELLELHPEHLFGEVFSDDVTLFRHPQLEGKPWCIRFQGKGAGFVFVSEGEELSRYAEAHPQGGDAEVSGYLSIEMTGEPYEAERSDEFERHRIPAPRPAGGMAPRQVFHMINCSAQGDSQEQAADDEEEASEEEESSEPVDTFSDAVSELAEPLQP